jgi:hypothetical protein
LGYVQLRREGADVRLKPVAELNEQLISGRLRTEAVGTVAAQAAFLEQLGRSGFTPDSVTTVAEVARVQTWLGDQVRKADPHPGDKRGYELLRHAQGGGSLVCGGMSDVLREAVVLLDLPARTVQLYESSFRRRPTHVVVEAYVAGSWRVFDPTYNVTYESEGEALGVARIQERLGRLGPEGVRARFHGERAYPADLERDLPGWRQVFANAYVSDMGRTPAPWKGLPPLRYWTGPTIYYFGDDLMPLPRAHERIYFLVTVVMPTLALICALTALVWPRRPAALAAETSRAEKR